MIKIYLETWKVEKIIFFSVFVCVIYKYRTLDVNET